MYKANRSFTSITTNRSYSYDQEITSTEFYQLTLLERSYFTEVRVEVRRDDDILDNLISFGAGLALGSLLDDSSSSDSSSSDSSSDSSSSSFDGFGGGDFGGGGSGDDY